jgi:hypothetical protein
MYENGFNCINAVPKLNFLVVAGGADEAFLIFTREHQHSKLILRMHEYESSRLLPVHLETQPS